MPSLIIRLWDGFKKKVHMSSRQKFELYFGKDVKCIFRCQVHNKGIFCNNSAIDTPILKRLYVENKAKLSQLEIVNKQYRRGDASSWESFTLFSTDNRFGISVSILLLLQNLPLLFYTVDNDFRYLCFPRRYLFGNTLYRLSVPS